MTAISRRLLPAGAMACALAVAAPAQAETYTPFDTGSMSENFTTLNGDLSELRYVLYCVDVGTLAMNDILVVSAESQVQQPSTMSNIEFGTQVSRTPTSCADIASNGYLYPNDGIGITASNGVGITPTEYRVVSPKVATEPITRDLTYQYVVYLVQASDVVNVVLGGGRLQVVKIHP
jgi:hypothetical protein